MLRVVTVEEVAMSPGGGKAVVTTGSGCTADKGISAQSVCHGCPDGGRRQA